MHNKFVNDRPSGWTAKSVASPQRGPLQKRSNVCFPVNAIQNLALT